MAELPGSFLESMKILLGEDYPLYLKTMEAEKVSGLRINTLKTSTEEFASLGIIEPDPVPWVENAYFVPENVRPALSPYYHAGLYYLQEPSAMTPGALLPLKPGGRVLDLCAAPGGKSTHLAARMAGSDVLFSNDVSNSRAQALLKNLELFGVPNAVLLNEEPQRLSPRFEAFFDSILIDAPCSGEGMFRKDNAVVRSYLEHGKEFYVELQKKIVPEAVKMLAPGGFLLYSTCTFSLEEDEEMVERMLDLCQELSVVPISGLYEGFSEGRPDLIPGADGSLAGCARLYPHKMRGEGHFVALMKKGNEAGNSGADGDSFTDIWAGSREDPVRLSEETEAFLSLLPDRLKQHLFMRSEKLYAAAFPDESLKGLRVLRNGLYLGEEKKKRFVPSQALAMCLKPGEFGNCLDLQPEDPRVIRYLKGETLEAGAGEIPADGITLVCISGHPLGFAKKSGTMLKNMYLPGWRFQGKS